MDINRLHAGDNIPEIEKSSQAEFARNRVIALVAIWIIISVAVLILVDSVIGGMLGGVGVLMFVAWRANANTQSKQVGPTAEKLTQLQEQKANVRKRIGDIDNKLNSLQ